MVALVAGSLLALLGAAILLGGLALAVVHAVARDDDGYYSSDTERLATGTYAITAEDIDLGSDAADWVPKDVLGQVRIRVEGAGGGPVFVGIAPEADVDGYLRGVAHAELEDLAASPARYRLRPGGAPRTRPGRQRFWVASAGGPGRQTLTWDAEGGRWAVVVMNADAARRVVVDASAGAKVGWLLWLGLGLIVAGLVLAAVGVVLIVSAARRAARDRASPPGAPPAAPPPAPG